MDTIKSTATLKNQTLTVFSAAASKAQEAREAAHFAQVAAAQKQRNLEYIANAKASIQKLEARKVAATGGDAARLAGLQARVTQLQTDPINFNGPAIVEAMKDVASFVPTGTEAIDAQIAQATEDLKVLETLVSAAFPA